MEYISSVEAAEKWDITPRQVQRLLAGGRIPHAKKYGRSWMIPIDTEKPGDSRRTAPPQASSLSNDMRNVLAEISTPAPHVNPYIVLANARDERLRLLHQGGLAYARGDFEQAISCYHQHEGDDAARLCAAMTAIAAAISLGNYSLYIEIEGYLKNIVEEDISSDVAAYAELALASAYLGAMAPDMVPDWLKKGDFAVLPPLIRLDAAYKRAKYFQCIGQYETMLTVAQTALSFTLSEQGVSFADIYLRMMCAVACFALHRAEEAERYLLDAMRIYLPHGFITPFAEHVPLFGGLLERLLKREFPSCYDAVLKQWERAFTHWITFHNRFTKENITLILSLRDYELALLVARRVPYAQIAKQYNISIGRVKNKMNEIFGKLYVSNRKELSKIIL